MNLINIESAIKLRLQDNLDVFEGIGIEPYTKNIKEFESSYPNGCVYINITSANRIQPAIETKENTFLIVNNETDYIELISIEILVLLRDFNVEYKSEIYQIVERVRLALENFEINDSPVVFLRWSEQGYQWETSHWFFVLEFLMPQKVYYNQSEIPQERFKMIVFENVDMAGNYTSDITYYSSQHSLIETMTLQLYGSDITGTLDGTVDVLIMTDEDIPIFESVQTYTIESTPFQETLAITIPFIAFKVVYTKNNITAGSLDCVAIMKGA